MRALLAANQARAGVDLAALAEDFAAAGDRAAAAGADVSPGSLVRGDIDGEYPVLTSAADRVAAMVQAASLRSIRVWHRILLIGAVALGLLSLALSALVVGPLAILIRRQRRRERQDMEARLEAAAYIRQVPLQCGRRRAGHGAGL